MLHNSKDYKGDLDKLRAMKRIIDGIASEPDNDRFHQQFSNQNSSEMFDLGFEQVYDYGDNDPDDFTNLKRKSEQLEKYRNGQDSSSQNGMYGNFIANKMQRGIQADNSEMLTSNDLNMLS